MNDSLPLLIESGAPLISIQTTDEERALRFLTESARVTSRPLYHWSMTQGLQLMPESTAETADAPAAKTILAPGKVAETLQYLHKHAGKGIYVFKDFGPHGRDALVHRWIRDLLDVAGERRLSFVLIDALPLPDELARFAVRFELGWPDAEELEAIIRDTYHSIRNDSQREVTSNIKRREIDQMVQTLRGLSAGAARRVVAAAILEDNVLDARDLPRIVEYKRQVLSGLGCLEAIAADFSSHEIGGLNRLKTWLTSRRSGFSRKAQEFGLESPRGVLMLGVPGCGKSLCAKVVAAEWGMPLLRLDPGVLYQKFVGETESQLRQALRQAESMAPAVLWIDEIEKAFASASASSADGGLSQRMFGTLLSWMQDHRHPIFIVATANDISALPPELMRKGRFDEVFFVDLPDATARERILRIHLARRKQSVEHFNLPELARMAHEFSGAELEQAIIAAMFGAFQHDRQLSNEDLEKAIRETRPLATLTFEKVTTLREWAQNRCVMAD